MGITLYTAPDCLRCGVVKAFLAEKGLEYAIIDFQAQKDEFNAFYRRNRPFIYRNPEGVEFPLFHDGTVITQGSGETIAYLLAGRELESCVTRSDLLHGWISGLYPSLCPPGQEDNFASLVRYLAVGGLKVYLHADGRKPALLKRLLDSGHVAGIALDILGPAEVYESSFGGPLAGEDLAESIALVRERKDGDIRILIGPTRRADQGFSWTTREEAARAAAMLAEADGDNKLPVSLAVVTKDMPQGLQGLEPFDISLMLSYRSACRAHLFKAEIQKH